MTADGTGMRVAVVGCGRWGRNHVRNYAALGALAAVVDSDPAIAAAEAARWGVPALDFAGALADPGLDGLVFALPPSQNLPLGRAALEAGKHLFVEKPLALSVRDGAALCGVAAERDRVLMVGHILRYHPAFVEMLRLADEGRFGRLLAITSTRLDLGRIRREEDALWALAPHDVSMVLALAGAAPERIAAMAGRHTHPAIADTVAVELAFPDGLRGEIRSSWLSPYKEQRLAVVGTEALALFDDREPWARKLAVTPWRLTETGRDPDLVRGEVEFVALAEAEPLREECRRFLAAMAGGPPPPSDGPEGLAVLAVLEEAAATLGRSRA